MVEGSIYLYIYIYSLCQKLGEILVGPTYKLLLNLTVISDSTVLLSGFQSSLRALKSTE